MLSSSISPIPETRQSHRARSWEQIRVNESITGKLKGGEAHGRTCGSWRGGTPPAWCPGRCPPGGPCPRPPGPAAACCPRSPRDHTRTNTPPNQQQLSSRIRSPRNRIERGGNVGEVGRLPVRRRPEVGGHRGQGGGDSGEPLRPNRRRSPGRARSSPEGRGEGEGTHRRRGWIRRWFYQARVLGRLGFGLFEAYSAQTKWWADSLFR